MATLRLFIFGIPILTLDIPPMLAMLDMFIPPMFIFPTFMFMLLPDIPPEPPGMISFVAFLLATR